MSFSLRLSRYFFARRATSFQKAEGGGAAVEFAIIGPVLLLIMSGIFSYGGYFLTAHTVQQLSNDAARAAIAGLDDTERLQLARGTVASGIASQSFMRGDSEVNLQREGDVLRVSVSYNASDDLYWAFQSLLPVPAPNISRTTTIRLGGLP